MINKDDKIFIAGHNGMVGSAIIRKLKINGFKNLLSVNSKELDLRNQKHTFDFLSRTKPKLIINAAAKVGGILANNEYPYDFIMDNMLIQNNLIDSAHKNNVEKFIFLGSSCIYPKYSKQPIKEEYLLSGDLEPTNQWYALAKISGLKAIESLRIQYSREYFSLMPTNLYGINDNFDLNSSHVLPALIRKFHEGKSSNSETVELWGDGSSLREFLNVDDLAEAVLTMINIKNPLSVYNVGSGKEFTIKALAEMVKKCIGFKGEIIWDKSKPNGTPRKMLDSSKILNLGFKPKINLIQGISDVYDWFLKNEKIIRTNL